MVQGATTSANEMQKLLPKEAKREELAAEAYKNARAIENLYLEVCASGIKDRAGFLAQTPDPPQEDTVWHAEALLTKLGALDDVARDGLSPLGRLLGSLPTHPRIPNSKSL